MLAEISIAVLFSLAGLALWKTVEPRRNDPRLMILGSMAVVPAIYTVVIYAISMGKISNDVIDNSILIATIGLAGVPIAYMIMNPKLVEILGEDAKYYSSAMILDTLPQQNAIYVFLGYILFIASRINKEAKITPIPVDSFLMAFSILGVAALIGSILMGFAIRGVISSEGNLDFQARKKAIMRSMPGATVAIAGLLIFFIITNPFQ